MENTVLTAEKRKDKEVGKKSTRKLKREDCIPATMYGLNKKPESIKIRSKIFKDLLKGHNVSSMIFDIDLKDDTKKREAVIVKDYQRNPLTREFMHLDFLRIQMKKEIETSVPIKILNEEISIGIKDGGGVLQHGLRELNISCLPVDIPENIVYDIKDLDMGIAIRVEDIEVSEKIKILNGPREVILSIIHPTQLKEEDLVTEEEEGEEEEAAAEEPELIGKEKPEEGEEPKEEGRESKEETKGSKVETKGFKKGSKKDKKESKN